MFNPPIFTVSMDINPSSPLLSNCPMFDRSRATSSASPDSGMV